MNKKLKRMNKVLLAIGLLALTFTACDKKKSSILPPPVVDTVYIDTNKIPPPIDTSLTIAGISDIRTTPWSEVMMPITVMRNIGTEQKVTMSISGVPAGVKAEFSSVSGYTTFNTNLMLDVRFATPGTYQLKIVSVSDQGKTKDFMLELVIDSMTTREINNLFMNKLQTTVVQTTDSADSLIYSNTSIQINTVENQLYLRSMVLHFSPTFTQYFLSYILNSNYHVKMMVDIATGKLTIPNQIVQGRSQQGAILQDFTVSGSGMIDVDNGIYTITYETIYDDNGNFVTSEYTMTGTLRD